MKKLVLIGIVGLAMMACTSGQAENDEERKVEYASYVDDPTTIAFEESAYDFGTVVDGDMVKHTYKFTNTGDKNLVLLNVKTSCGCTIPEDWPKQPIAPGEGGEIKVIFNSNDRVGNVNKSIRVEANTQPTLTSLKLTGVVKEGEN